MNILVDAMGGDHAPASIVAGAVEAVRAYAAVRITLVGQEKAVRAHLAGKDFPRDRISVVHAPEVVGMEDAPTDVIRRKKDSSMALGLTLLRKGGYDAFVSAGNTGALVAGATFYLRMIEGVDRPGIGLVIPQIHGSAFLIDVGANADPKPEHLFQYGLMARVYAQSVLGRKSPTVGLVNIGEEAGKGSGVEKQAYDLLKEKCPGFVGNIEPNKLFVDKADCVICTGFVGNVIIKLSEGLMESAGKVLKREIKKNPVSMFGAMLMSPAMKGLRKHADYTEYGGAPLLGVNGIVMKSHGRSSPKAIRNAIRAAMHEVDYGILDHIRKALV